MVGWSIVVLTAALAFVSLRIYPHYLAYFNVFAGGPDNGWRSLVDSNIDWGQDLEALGPWMSDNQVERVWLSYFGEARPDYYDIAYDGLDSFPPRLMNPETRPFFPSDPAPGWYAISATNLQGVHFLDHDEFAYFREREPDDKLGYSIFLYNVAAYGEPANLILGGLQPDQIAPQDWANLETNDVTLRWLDGRQALLLPQDGRPTWFAAGTDTLLTPEWQAMLDKSERYQTASKSGYSLWRLPAELAETSTVRSRFTLGENAINLMDSTHIGQDGRKLTLVSDWQQQGEPAPVKIFVHVLDESGELAAQWDGLGAAWEGWRTGDFLRQRHTLELPADAPAGTYQLVIGLYDPETLERWRLPSGADFVELTEITIP